MASLKTLLKWRKSKKRKRSRSPRGSAAWKRITKAIARLDKAIRRKRKKRAKNRADGRGAWGGSKRVVRREVAPVVAKHGFARTSAKRWSLFGNPSSDHYRGNLTAYAEDYATANNHALADEIGRRLGIVEEGEHIVDYRAYYITRGGRRFRIQIIAGTHGTGPHLHVGVKRA